ncbi:DUF309 domain-containing protein [Sulfobacillus thermosulfidooxidans]|uniref:DUF309 domain-containing protein n=1 Tax=Sulfobacillus thermosulfidooxidans TaxID=28034 RepID=UPI00096BA5A6|nr:DUF309 domain-containing protein [Sulfobacillus thermosulfidooxidans]OLZ09266.1 hypothetical protein BFX05_14195 [Sulfobacillus thermosulfidooxidans]OLZ13420.1 hypothetical protein BFX06_09605 [Sulfobacillus thermosulfidooxidans]OLZ21667.1 hypothetical protein BFX07_12655 [Sulfobacillus thermosulfidooxidans]
MKYTLALLWDAKSTRAIAEVCAALTEAGLRPKEFDPVLGPHMTLFSTERLDPFSFQKGLEECVSPSSAHLPALLLEKITTFPHAPHDLFIEVLPHAPLKNLYDHWLKCLSPSMGRLMSTSLSHSWIPGVTLASHLGGRLLARSRHLALNLFTPLIGHITGVVVYQSEPSRHGIYAYYPLNTKDLEGSSWFLFNHHLMQQQYFSAHEDIEALWRQHHDTRSQSTIWIAALFVHWQRQQFTGASKILGKFVQDPTRIPPLLLPCIKSWQIKLSQQTPLPLLNAFERMALIRWARYEWSPF